MAAAMLVLLCTRPLEAAIEEFRKTFKKENPTVKVVSVVGKVGGEKWKSLSAAVNPDSRRLPLLSVPCRLRLKSPIIVSDSVVIHLKGHYIEKCF
ncbi:hypothetical protein L6452_43826 [Arctium lappa]|uniref:Uncharacterized protein n=1 Tax=Arctium lappa TaxID=4217 RepID=A0ACB8XDY4_ARCLA|nr:hypothetical protein L6452_43826 [Arctium lappa]